MKVVLDPGIYVVAVSGGVDSVSLLHMLAEQARQTAADPRAKTQLIVAHFDHGIRSDSHLDRRLVQAMAKQLGLPFVYQEGKLGAGASEAQARSARYDFLRSLQHASGAQALVTAHHQDDLLETAIINILRGTHRKGITSLADHSHLRRPLLAFPKAELQRYAAEQGLLWREDSTNSDTTILRNYIRQIILPKLGPAGRQQLHSYISHLSVVNRSLDNDLLIYLHLQPSRQTLDRHAFTGLPHAVSMEVFASWLRSHHITTFDTPMLERLVEKSKTLPPGKHIDLYNGNRIMLGQDVIALVTL